MSDSGESFGRGVFACVQEINKYLPGMNRRYEPIVIITAMAEHVGSALRILIRRQVCDARQAKQVISHIEGTAFLRKTLRQMRTAPGPGAAPTE